MLFSRAFVIKCWSRLQIELFESRIFVRSFIQGIRITFVDGKKITLNGFFQRFYKPSGIGSLFRLWMVLVVFAAGSLPFFLSNPILEFFGVEQGRFCRHPPVLLSYSALSSSCYYGFIFGQFHFSWEKESRFRRIARVFSKNQNRTKFTSSIIDSNSSMFFCDVSVLESERFAKVLSWIIAKLLLSGILAKVNRGSLLNQQAINL